MEIGRALAGVEGRWVRYPQKSMISGADCDSRRVGRGFLFVAYRGDAADGHDYIDDALRRGASVIVAERRVPVPEGVGLYLVDDGRLAAAKIAANIHPRSQDLTLIAVTGTAGKTTTTLLIRHILNSSSIPCAALTTIAYYTSEKPHPSENTTPGPFRLHALLEEAARNGHRACVMEVSSHAICQRRVEGLRFGCGVLTNIGSDHLDYHRTHSAYRTAKRRLFESLAPDAVAVLNADDRWFCEFAGAHRGPTLTYGLRRGMVRGRVLAADIDGMVVEVHFGGREGRFWIPLVGLHNAYNALASVAAALSVGVPFEEALFALEDFGGVAGRLERVWRRPAVFVDYAHTENALKAALTALKPHVRGRLILVFGCGGDRDRTKRPRMGRVAERFADIVVVTSDNPRSENPQSIIAEILDGMSHPEKAVVEVDRHAAIKRAVSIARRDDVVLIAGKGHETVQIVGSKLIPFDDRKIARESLERLARLKRGRSVA